MKKLETEKLNYWCEVERALEENSISGFKIACIESEKVFKHLLKSKGYPVEDIRQTLSLFGWKLANKESLVKAIDLTEKIKESFDYRLSNFEAEDIVEAFKQGIADFTEAKDLTWQRKAILLWENYFSFKSSFLKKFIVSFLAFFLVIKLLSSTSFGSWIVSTLVSVSNFIYSWFLLFSIIVIAIFIFVISAFLYFEKGKTRIKSIKEK